MRPACVFANSSDSEIDRLRASLRGRWRQAEWAVMVLLSLHGLPAAQIGALLEWTAPGMLEALIPGRMQSHASTAEVP
jgi:hypothetical protein